MKSNRLMSLPLVESSIGNFGLIGNFQMKRFLAKKYYLFLVKRWLFYAVLKKWTRPKKHKKQYFVDFLKLNIKQNLKLIQRLSYYSSKSRNNTRLNYIFFTTSFFGIITDHIPRKSFRLWSLARSLGYLLSIALRVASSISNPGFPWQFKHKEEEIMIGFV